MVKRTAAERERHPSVVQRDLPEVCARCKPMLANEEKFHAEAFQTLARALDATLAELSAARERIAALEREAEEAVERA